MATASGSNSLVNLFTVLNPFTLWEIFNKGNIKYKIAIFFAGISDYFSILRIILIFFSLGSLASILEPVEAILTIANTILLPLMGFSIKKELFFEFIPGLDAFPFYSLIVYNKFLNDSNSQSQTPIAQQTTQQTTQVQSMLVPNQTTVSFNKVLIVFATMILMGAMLMFGGSLGLIGSFILVVFLILWYSGKLQKLGFIPIFLIMGTVFMGFFVLIGSLNIPGLPGLYTNAGNLPGTVVQTGSQALEQAPTLLAKIGIWLKGIPSTFEKWWERQKAIATGDYYTGNVDKYANKNLGVFLKEVKSGEKEYYLGESSQGPPVPIEIFGQIEGASLDVDDCESYLNEEYILNLGYTEEELKDYYSSQNRLYKNKEDCELNQKVELECNLTNKHVSGRVNPPSLNLFDIQGGSTAVDCNIPADKNDLVKIKDGSEVVDFKVRFPFVTKSYIKTYFMETQKLRDMKRQKLNPLDEYKITDKKPVAVYTGGPIMIGLGIIDELPLTVSLSESEQQRTYRLGITIENKWNGKVSGIEELRVIIPKELVFECPLFDFVEGEENNYLLNDIGKKQVIGSGGIASAKTYNCRIFAKDIESARSLLNNIPLVTKYVKVSAKYKYELEESTTLRLKIGDGLKKSLSDCTTTCDDYDGCFCDADCEKGGYKTEAVFEKNCNGDYIVLNSVRCILGLLSGSECGMVSSSDVSTANNSKPGSISGSNLKVLSRYGNPSQMEQVYGPYCDVKNYPIISYSIIGDMSLNPKAESAFKTALALIEQDGYGGLIKKDSGWGHYICRNVRGGTTFSAHAWGVAVDINVHMGPNAKRSADGKSIEDYDKLESTNFKIGGAYEPLKFLADNYFIPAGIAWGGYWQEPDPMHFEAT